MSFSDLTGLRLRPDLFLVVNTDDWDDAYEFAGDDGEERLDEFLLENFRQKAPVGYRVFRLIGYPKPTIAYTRDKA